MFLFDGLLSTPVSRVVSPQLPHLGLLHPPPLTCSLALLPGFSAATSSGPIWFSSPSPGPLFHFFHPLHFIFSILCISFSPPFAFHFCAQLPHLGLLVLALLLATAGLLHQRADRAQVERGERRHVVGTRQHYLLRSSNGAVV